MAVGVNCHAEPCSFSAANPSFVRALRISVHRIERGSSPSFGERKSILNTTYESLST
jgi:hypothetical protein